VDGSAGPGSDREVLRTTFDRAADRSILERHVEVFRRAFLW